MAVTVDHVKKVVAAAYGLSKAELVGRSKAGNRAKARQIAMALAKEQTGLSLTAIGNLFGRRDHTTVMHARRCIEKGRWAEEFAEMRRAVLSEALDASEPEQKPEVAPEPALVAPMPPVVAPPPVFVPRKVSPARIIRPIQKRRVVTGSLLGDPGYESPRLARGETSVGVD